MLTKFVKPEEGDVIIQNGGNSGCGQAVIQVARKLGLYTVNVVRDRENIAELKSELMGMGADYVLTEDELRSTQIFKSGEFPRPKLALNCVGGKSSTELIKVLAPNGIHVTYGGMSMKPVGVPASGLIFKDVEIKGFWLSRWIDENFNSEEMLKMYEFLGEMALKGELTGPKHVVVPLKDYKNALAEAAKGFRTQGKIIFDLTQH